MRKTLLLAGLLAALMVPMSSKAQVGLSINIGPAPVCPYGYFSYAPYACAPYGYYGPAWFRGGVFLGAGPWFRGPRNFHGYVNNRFDPHHGYHGSMPQRGARPAHHPGSGFRGGNEQRDGRGHTVGGGDHGHGH